MTQVLFIEFHHGPQITCTVAACVTFHFFLKELPNRLQKMKLSNSKLIFSADSSVKTTNSTITKCDINSLDSSFICIHTRAEDKTIQDKVDLVTASVHTEHLSAETSGATQGATHNDEQATFTFYKMKFLCVCLYVCTQISPEIQHLQHSYKTLKIL